MIIKNKIYFMIEMLKNKIVIGIIVCWAIIVIVMELFIIPKYGG